MLETSAPDIGSAPQSNLPKHVAIIMDGNNRWAKKRGLAGVEGHKQGAKVLRKIVENSAAKGIKALTVFAFSSENWRRPKEEVNALMSLFLDALERQVPELDGHDIQLRFIGELNSFSAELQARMKAAMSLTSNNQRMTLSVAVNYGGRWDVANAAQNLMHELYKQGAFDGGDLPLVDEHVLAPFLSLSDLPDPDLCIRTGGENRISNFLLWQFAYSELYFSDRYWPDFDECAYSAALDDYAQRQRRFGRTSEQVAQTVNKEPTNA